MIQRNHLIVRIACLLALVLTTGNKLCAQQYRQTEQGVTMTVHDMEVVVEFYSPRIVRIVKKPVGSPLHSVKSLSVTKQPQPTKFTLQQTKEAIRLKSEFLELVVNSSDGSVLFRDEKKKVLLAEKGNGTSFKPFNDAGINTLTVAQSFTLDQDEPIYGLGILQNGKMSQRNQKVRMVQNNTWDFVTFFQSIKGYGVYWDNYSPTTFADDENGTSFSSEVGTAIDYYFMHGGSADAVVAQMRELTGQVPLFPLWTYGYWQSKERYKSQQEIVGVVKKYRDLGVPLDGIIQDWQYWGNNYQWNAMDFISPDFPDAKKMVSDIHGMNARLAVSIWSSFGPMTKPYRELDSKGMLFNFKTWPESGRESWPPDLNYPSGVRVYDAYNPEARNIYWKYLNEGVFKLGIDAWWMDSTEPDHLSQKPEDMDTKTYLGSLRKVRNAYPLMTVGGVYDNQRATSSDKRVFILTRSAFAGQQRYGASVWSGDVNSSWESLRNQVPAGLNFTLTGNPHFNSDIGGFFAGAYNKTWNDGSGSKNPMFQELYVRWLQYATFTPMMRSHGTDVPREIYQFGKKGDVVYDAIESFIKLRYSLLPYIYSTSWDVSANQSSFMRALAMDFVADRKVWDLGNQYLFGKSLLVVPVVQAQYTPEKVVKTNEQDGWDKNEGSRREEPSTVDFNAPQKTTIYLPAGTSWFDFWTNERIEGGREIEKKINLSSIPVYVKAGSIIPMGPEVQYATEKPWNHLTLKIYPGADASFVLYEDEFDNYNYEKGAFSTIEFKWNDKQRTLTIVDREGDYKGMIGDRDFTVELIGEDQRLKVPQKIRYTGKQIKVKV